MIQQLVQARKYRGMSQSEVARRLFISVTSINRWERGIRQPTAPVLVRWATILGYRWELIMTGTPK